jgi:hypothetical protein
LEKIRLEAHDAGVGVGVVLDVVVLHILFGFIEMPAAQHDAEKVISDFLVRGEFGILALEQRGLVGGRLHGDCCKNRRCEQSEREGAMESSHVQKSIVTTEGIDKRIQAGIICRHATCRDRDEAPHGTGPVNSYQPGR